MSILVSFAFLTIICVLVKFTSMKKNHRLYQLLKQFPSHPTYPLIGNLHLLLNPMDGIVEKAEKILQPHDRQVFWLGPTPVLVLKKYDDIAFVMSQCQDRDLLGKIKGVGDIGLITARYKEWKTSRRILNPAFTSQMLSKYLQVFNKNSSILVENLKSKADTGEEVDIFKWMSKSGLDSIVENAMGISIRSNEKSEQDFFRAIHGLFKSVIQRINYPLLYPNHVYKLYLKITKKNKIIQHAKSFSTQMLRKKLNQCKDFQCHNTSVDDAHSSRTIIDLLINKSLTDPDFTETRIRDELLQTALALPIHLVEGTQSAMKHPVEIYTELNTFFIGFCLILCFIKKGYGSTALALSFLMVMLAINQDAQQKVYEEISQLSSSHSNIDGALTENDLNDHLGYLEQCIKETLRMFSPVIADVRRTHKEFFLDGKTVPANLLIITLIYFANKDSTLYKNPTKWDPEHFTDQAINERPKESQLSFGYGPRSCIGAKYAMMDMKTRAVHILRKYHLTTSVGDFTNKDLSMDISIISKRGYPVKLTSR